jgi:hypothetical protein
VCLLGFFAYDFRNDEQSNKSPLPVSSTISRRKLMPRDLGAYRVTKSCPTATGKKIALVTTNYGFGVGDSDYL